jgi:hypothetical protein
MEMIKRRLPPEQRPAVEETIEKLRTEQTSVSELTKERQRYGVENVDLMLKFEDPLLENYTRAVEAPPVPRATSH